MSVYQGENIGEPSQESTEKVAAAAGAKASTPVDIHQDDVGREIAQIISRARARGDTALPPAPTFEEQLEIEREARSAGVAEQDILAFVQQQWMNKYGLRASDIARTGQIMGGVTTKINGRIVANPPPGTLAEPVSEDKPVKVYDDRGNIKEISRAQLSNLSHMNDRERFQQMQDWGVISQNAQLTPGGYLSAASVATVKVAEKRQQDYERKNVKLSDGNWVSKDFVEQLEKESPQLARTLRTRGLDAYNTQVKVIQTANKNIQTAQDKLTPYTKTKLTERALMPYISDEATDKLSQQGNLPGSQRSVDIAGYLRDNPNDELTLKIAGFTGGDIKEAKQYNRLYYGIGAPDYVPLPEFTEQYFKDNKWNYNLHRGAASNDEVAEYDAHLREARAEHEQTYKTEQSLDQHAQQYFERKGWNYDINRGVADTKDIQEYDMHLREATADFTQRYGMRYFWEKKGAEAVELAERTIPIYGTAKYWNEMTPAEKVINVGLDAWSIAMILTGASGMVRGGVSAKAALSKAVVNELKAPFTVIRHPVRTIKGSAYSLYDTLETLIRGKKIPLAAVETAYSTVRIPLGQTDLSPAELKALRDALTKEAVRGGIPIAQVDDVIGELRLSALQKVKPVAVHASPDVRPFLEGAQIQAGREGGLFLAPNLHSRFTYSSAFGDLPEGGVRGALIINDQDMLMRLQSSGKLYDSPKGTVAEIESVLKGGESLPPPAQVLVTRDLNGDKLTLLVFGKPYTATELARLKIMGSVDTLTGVFKKPLQLAETSGDYADLMKLRVEAQELTGQLANAKKIGAAADAAKLDDSLGVLNERIDRLATRVELSYRTPAPLKMIGTYTSKDFMVRDGEALRRPGEKDILPRATARIPETLRRAERSGRTDTTADIRTMRTDTGDREDKRFEQSRKEESRGREDISRVEQARGMVRTTPVRGKATNIVPETPRTRISRTPETFTPKETPTHRIAKGNDVAEKTDKPSEYSGAIAWQQGIGWWVFKAPYREEDLSFHPGKKPPAGVRIVSASKRAYDTIQQVTGEPPKRPVSIDMGITDIEVSKPAFKPGKTGIKFTADPLRRTRGDITVTRDNHNLLNRKKNNHSPLINNNTLVSTKKGRIYHTKSRGGELLSRRPLGRNSKR